MIGGDYSGITNESVVFIEFGLTMVALPAERHVHICTSNQCSDIFGSCPEGETRVFFAKLANGAELLYFFAFRD